MHKQCGILEAFLYCNDFRVQNTVCRSTSDLIYAQPFGCICSMLCHLLPILNLSKLRVQQMTPKSSTTLEWAAHAQTAVAVQFVLFCIQKAHLIYSWAVNFVLNLPCWETCKSLYLEAHGYNLLCGLFWCVDLCLTQIEIYMDFHLEYRDTVKLLRVDIKLFNWERFKI